VLAMHDLTTSTLHCFEWH